MNTCLKNRGGIRTRRADGATQPFRLPRRALEAVQFPRSSRRLARRRLLLPQGSGGFQTVDDSLQIRGNRVERRQFRHQSRVRVRLHFFLRSLIKRAPSRSRLPKRSRRRVQGGNHRKFLVRVLVGLIEKAPSRSRLPNASGNASFE